MVRTKQSEAGPPGHPSFAEALRFWWKLGWISFGGPAGQIAIMHKELIERRRWLGEGHFLHALNFCMLLPGPEAQQLATYLGWRLHGARGGLAAGALFVLPSAFILFGLSWLYMAGGELGWVRGMFHGLVPAVIAIVVEATARIGKKTLRSPGLWAVAVGAFVAIRVFDVPFVAIIVSAAGIGWLGGRWFARQFPVAGQAGDAGGGDGAVVLRPTPRAGWRRSFKIVAGCLLLWWLPVVAAGIWRGWDGVLFQEGVFFSKAALVTFGGAYAVLPYVAQQAVETHGWLGHAEMMAGLGLAESTPGPLIMVLQFVGFVGGWNHAGDLPPLLSATLGAAITTWVTFVPCFLFVFLGGPHVEGLRARPALAAALTGITAAVAGVIANLAVWFAWHSFRPQPGVFDFFVPVLAIAAWIAMERWKFGVIPTLAAAALIGVAWQAAGYGA